MHPATLTALLASIAKWEANAKVSSFSKAEIFNDTCALCDLFYDEGCRGCPVAEETGNPCCEGSPWSVVLRIWESCLEEMDLESFREASAKEAAFLTSLLPLTKGA